MTATVIQAASAVLVPSAAMAMWLLRKRSATGTIDLDDAADNLAIAVRAQWERAAVERRLRYPTPIPVRWSWSFRIVGGPRTDVFGDPSTPTRTSALPGLGPIGPLEADDGGLSDLFRVFGGLESGRIVLLGAAGSGKSSAAIMLLLDALEHRASLVEPTDRRRTPVPVMLSLSGWDATRQTLSSWASARMELEYPFLLAAEFGRDTAKELVDNGRVALLLDGLDDLPKQLRPVALRALNDQACGRLVLLSRSTKLAAAVRVGVHFAGAAMLELQPVTPQQAADYLQRCRIDPAPPDWRKLVEHIRDQRDPALTQALDNPLMLSLVRDTYEPGEGTADLFPLGGFRNRRAVEDQLLNRIVTTAYTAHPGRDKPRYTPEEASRWLGTIAAHMQAHRTRNLAWWTMSQWQPRWQRAVATSMIILLTLGFGLSLVVGGRVSIVVISYAVAVGVLLGLVYGSGMGQPRQWSRIRWSEVHSPANIRTAGLFMLTIGSVFSAMFTFWFGYPYGVRAGLLSGVCCGVVTWFFYSAARPSVEPLSPNSPKTCWDREQRYRLAFGLALGLTFGMVVMWANWLDSRADPRLVMQIFDGMSGAIPYGLMFGLVSSKTWAARLTFLQLKTSGSGPLRMIRFLEDASARGVLRTVGPVYQFRHARLQDRLAEDSSGT
ncbi:hypothetical protein L3Q67_02015 [Saccharothrix sp. AJ9571]|nr:hypothetical protein L3Q67_02015 [Saccharothrix sp. AJ9571]